MTKKVIDYTKTIFYKIVCNDLNIKDCYIGHTTNFTKRKTRHKSNCNNENTPTYNLNVYKFIRDNGGWSNWSMIMIDEVKCENVLDARKKEREYIELLKPQLNKEIPTRTQKEWEEANKEKLKEYREQHTNKMKEYNKIYYEVNKNELLEKNKEYRDQHKDKIKEYNKNNKDKIKEYKQQLIFCECCKIDIKKDKKSRHYKTMKHIKNASTEVVI
jgi:hypothetical protein